MKDQLWWQLAGTRSRYVGVLDGQFQAKFTGVLKGERHRIGQPGADRDAQSGEHDTNRVGTGWRARRNGPLVAGGKDPR